MRHASYPAAAVLLRAFAPSHLEPRPALLPADQKPENQPLR